MQANEVVKLKVSLIDRHHFFLQDRPGELRASKNAASVCDDSEAVTGISDAGIFEEDAEVAIFACVSVDF